LRLQIPTSSTPSDLLSTLNYLKVKRLKVRDYLQHDGFNYSVDREDGCTIIVLGNSRHPVGGEISNSIRSIINNEAYITPLERRQVEIDKSLLTRYAGKYELAENQYIDIEFENDSIFVFMGPNKIHLIPQSENQFFMKERDASVRFVLNEVKEVTGIVLLDGFIEGRYIKKVTN